MRWAKIPRRAKGTRDKKDRMRVSMLWRMASGIKKRRLTKENKETKKVLTTAIRIAKERRTRIDENSARACANLSSGPRY